MMIHFKNQIFSQYTPRATISLYSNISSQNNNRRWLNMSPWLIYATIGLVFSTTLTAVSARDIEYCSNVNTADSDATQNKFQSNGLCYDQCKSNYAFAIVQGDSCWCSNYAPSSDNTGCDESCPGFPPDKCGNTEKALYGYMSLDKSPSGTKGASSDPTVSLTSFEPSTQTVISDKPGTTATVIITTTTQNPTTSSKKITKESTRSTPTTTSSDSTTLLTKATPKPRVTVITKVDGYKTVTISPTGSTAPTNTAPTANSGSDSFFSNTGRAVGLFVGLALLLILLIGAFFFWRHRRNKYQEALYSEADSPNSTAAGPSGRQRSRSLSTLGLIGEKGLPPINTSPIDTQNFTNSNAASAVTQAAGGVLPKAGQVFDQRLDPGQLFMRFDHDTGSSRMSVRSLRDDTDYSRRVLRLANPDD